MSHSPSEKVDWATAMQIVQTLIDMAPRFRTPTSPEKFNEIVGHWHRALNLNNSVIPQQIYLDAVDSWLSEANQDTWYPAPGDIIAHTRKVMERIDRDPVRGPKMREWLEEQKQARIALLVGDDDA